MINDETIELVTKSIRKFVKHYTGKLSHGNLRIPSKKDFSHQPKQPVHDMVFPALELQDDRVYWALSYQTPLRSSKQVSLVYVPSVDSWTSANHPYVIDSSKFTDRTHAYEVFCDSIVDGIPADRLNVLLGFRKSGGNLVDEIVKQSHGGEGTNQLPLSKLLTNKELHAVFSPDEISRLKSECYGGRIK